MTTYHIAQVNIGQIKAPLEDQVMSGFVARLDEINALADSSPGFVWRLQSPAGNATYLRPYENDRILLNMSVWETIDALKDYVTAPLTRSFCANGTIGLKNSRACTPLCGGFDRTHSECSRGEETLCPSGQAWINAVCIHFQADFPAL